MQLPEDNAQMDGPGEATRQSAWPSATTKPRKRGNPVLSGDQFLWESCVGTLPPSAPINTPTDATQRAYRI